MSDDLKNRGPRDGDRVNVNEKWEVEYWTKHLNCTEAELRAAVRRVLDAGKAPMKEHVAAELKKK